MAAIVNAEVPAATGAGAEADQQWPKESRGWFALFVIVLTMFLTFFDQTVFAMLAEKMRASFGLSDSALGFLLGPASVVAFVFVGIPLSRLVDIYPRKFVLAAGIAVMGTIMRASDPAMPVYDILKQWYAGDDEAA